MLKRQNNNCTNYNNKSISRHYSKMLDNSVKAHNMHSISGQLRLGLRQLWTNSYTFL